MYYTVANAYAGLASKESSDLKFEVKNTAGSAANLRLLSGNYIDLGIAQADLVRAAHEGTGSFSDNRQQGYRAIAGLYTEACQIVVRADSDIRTLMICREKPSASVPANPEPNKTLPKF